MGKIYLPITAYLEGALLVFGFSITSLIIKFLLLIFFTSSIPHLETLFLLTGILGGSKVKCDSYLKINESVVVNQSADVGLVHESVGLTRINEESNTVKKNEIYGNTGSPMLIKYETWDELKENIKDYFDIIDEIIFNHNIKIRNKILINFFN